MAETEIAKGIKSQLIVPQSLQVCEFAWTGAFPFLLEPTLEVSMVNRIRNGQVGLE